MTKHIDHKVSKRPDRVPLYDQARNVLTVKGKEDGFEYRWFNDEDERISNAKLGGWEIVTNEDLKIGDRTVDSTGASSASPVSKKVGLGVTAFLMRIPKEFYDEDQRKKQEALDERENTMRSEALAERYGKFEIGRK